VSNHLKNETSAYLKEYVNSQVAWHPYNEESFKRAKEEKRPIFLSIGYSGSYWCDVMRKESFEDPIIAKLLNEHFIPIKVDKDERTDLDKYYKQVYKLMNGQSCASPISLFLTEDREPFYAAAYIGTTPRGNVLDFYSLLNVVIEKYKNDKATMVQKAQEVLHHMPPPKGKIQATRLHVDIIKTIKQHALNLFDKEEGGFGTEPKFLQLSTLDLLLEAHKITQDPELLSMVTFSFDKMIQGEIHDKKNGGFFHYANKQSWAMPRPEKMLYDNAYIASLLLKLSEITQNKTYQETALKTIEYTLKHFTYDGLFGSNGFEQEGTWHYDPKIVTSFNAMMISTLLEASKIDAGYLKTALDKLDQLLQQHYSNNRLYHTQGVPAFLEDYAYLGQTLLQAYHLTHQADYLLLAERLANQSINYFYEHGLWRFSQELPELYDDIHDPLYPSALATELLMLQDLSLKIDSDYTPIVFKTLEVHSYNLMRQPLSSPQLTKALLRHLKKML